MVFESERRSSVSHSSPRYCVRSTELYGISIKTEDSGRRKKRVVREQ